MIEDKRDNSLFVLLNS